MIKSIAIFTIYAFISAYGLYYIKTPSSWNSINFISGIFLYGTGFIIWLYILKRYPLSSAFPIAASSLIIATQLFGILFLRESVCLNKIIGVIFIIIGIFFLYFRFGDG